MKADLLPYVSNVATSMKRIVQDDQFSETVNITHLQDFEQYVKALVQETLWFLNMQKVSSGHEEEMRTIVQDVETQMRKIVSIGLSECVSLNSFVIQTRFYNNEISCGGLAQMGERSLSMREVPGSIPGFSILLIIFSIC